jgi:hypothetical protein
MFNVILTGFVSKQELTNDRFGLTNGRKNAPANIKLKCMCHMPKKAYSLKLLKV